MDEETLQKLKRAFLDSYDPPRGATTPKQIALANAIITAVRRNPTYSRDITLLQKSEAVNFWKEEIEKRGEKYLQTPQAIETYTNDVLEMRAAINKKFAGVLQNSVSSGIRIAHCQKSLSIYLKYMWCQGISTATPPACPIDRVVLTHCGIFDIAWTRLDKVDEFNNILKQIESTKNTSVCHSSIAEWELCIFNLSNHRQY